MSARAVRDASRCRSWCFTLNNYTDDDWARILDVPCEYLVVGKESGKDKHTPHLQGFVYFKSRKSFAVVSGLISGRAHLERAKGTPAQNRLYCIKEGHFQERGVLPQAGKRTDLMDMRDMMKAGEPLHKIIGECRSYQAMRGAELLSKYNNSGSTKKTAVEVLWFYGPTGSGKTYTAYKVVEERKMEENLWVSSDSLQWFDGYGGQEAVILDDIRRDDVKFNFFLRLLDGYRIRVPIKGGFVQWSPKLIIITCPMMPDDFCPCTENKQQLLRRITTVRKFEVRVEDGKAEKEVINIE